MAYIIQRQSTTGLWIIVDTSTGTTVSRAELPSDAVNLAVTKGIPRGDLAGLVESAQAQERAENQAASSQTAGDSQGVNRGSDGTGTTSNSTDQVTAEEKNNIQNSGEDQTEAETRRLQRQNDDRAEPVKESTSTNAAQSVSKQGTLESLGITITPNVLHNYSTYTYGLTLHLLAPDTYNAMARGETWLPEAKTIISSAGRWGQDPGSTTKFNRPAIFSDDFYFDGFNISTVIGLSAQGRSSNVIDISFNLIEPYGLTLLNRLLAMADDLGIPNYLANPYVLQIDFFGNSEAGELVHPVPNITKYIPLKIIEMKIKVGTSGATYACRAIPYNHVAFSQNISSTPANFEITAKTIKDFFQNDADEANLAVAAKKNQQRQSDIATEEYRINPGVGPVDPRTAATSQEVIKKKKEALAKPYEVNSYNGAYNAYQLFLVGNKSIQHPTKIKFEIDSVISDSLIVYDKKNSAQASPMNSNQDSKSINKSYVSNNSNAAGPQLGLERFNINAGTSVIDVINLVMRNSNYITDQLKDKQQLDKNGNPLNWFKVVPQIQLTNFDSKKNDYSYDVTFKIKAYSYHNSKHPLVSVSSTEQITRNLRKRYDYIYTGKNSDIIDFSIDFDSLFYTAVNVGTTNLEKLSDSQDALPTETGSAGSRTANDPRRNDYHELPAQNTSKVNPNQVYPTSGDLSSGGFNSGQNSSIQRAADVMKSIYSSSRGDMINLKLKIIGDPDFIKQDDLYLSPGNFNYPADSETRSDSGSILTDRGDIFALVTFKTPVDIDTYTGGLRTDEKYLESNFSGIYKIIKVSSEFRSGKFEQTLEMIRFHDEAVDSAVAASIEQRTDINASTPANQTLLNQRSAPVATNSASLRNAINQASGEPTQSYSGVDQARIENTELSQTSKLEEVAVNGETRNVTEVQATGSTSKDSTADNTAAAPPAPAPDPTPNKEQQIKELEAKQKSILSNINAKEKALSEVNQQSLEINKQIKAARAAGDLNLSAGLEQQYKKLEAQSLDLQEMIRVRSQQVNDIQGQINQLKGLY